ncbi:MAG: hypothetical protein Q3M30_04665 [Candidatus Electrothrix sp. Rat3]|nr:hypothetical protein [Candidatus Electrothrix rattekaaiensis]
MNPDISDSPYDYWGSLLSPQPTGLLGFVPHPNLRGFMMRKISSVVTKHGCSMPVICSPEEFMEAEHD